jgi:hypothetical protein
MVGGKLIEIKPMRLESGREVVRLWCVEAHTGDRTPDECAVYSEPFEAGAGPKVGESIWWQGGEIMFDGDKRTLRKVGFSFDPRNT